MRPISCELLVFWPRAFIIFVIFLIQIVNFFVSIVSTYPFTQFHDDNYQQVFVVSPRSLRKRPTYLGKKLRCACSNVFGLVVLARSWNLFCWLKWFCLFNCLYQLYSKVYHYHHQDTCINRKVLFVFVVKEALLLSAPITSCDGTPGRPVSPFRACTRGVAPWLQAISFYFLFVCEMWFHFHIIIR